MTDAAVLVAKVKGDTKEAEDGLKRIHDQIDGLGSRLKGLASLGSGFKSLTADAVAFGSSLKQGLEIGAGIVTMQAAVNVLKAAFGAAKGSLIDFNQQLEQAEIVLSQFFATAEDTKRAIDLMKRVAADTPFEFKDINRASKDIANLARYTGDYEAMLKATIEAVASTGSTSSETFHRVSVALGQIASKGKVTAEELTGQLGDAGVRVWEVLSEYFGKSTAEVQKMVTDGKVSGKQFAEAWQTYFTVHGGYSERMSKTFQGAMSTIRDELTMTSASSFKPFYDLLTEGAVKTASFLKSEAWATWAEATRQGAIGASEAVKGFIAFLTPLGEGIKGAFEQATKGDFSGAFESLKVGAIQQLSYLWDYVQGFGRQMFGGGYAVIESFAQGMWQAGTDAVAATVDAIATMIADFLIGQSPPPAGPLANIDKGGENVGKAWATPFGDAIKDGASKAVEAVGSEIKGLEATGREAGRAIHAIDQQIQGLDRSLREIKNAREDIKDTIGGELEAVEAQLRGIKERRDYQDEELALLYEAEQLELNRAKAVAQGSAEERYRLSAILDGINAEKEALAQTFRRAELERKVNQEATEAEERLQELKDEGRRKSDTTALEEKLRRLRDSGGDTRKAGLTDAERELEALRDAERLRGNRPKSDAEKRLEALKTARGGKSATEVELDDQRKTLALEEERLRLADRLKQINDRAAKGENVTLARQELELDQRKYQINVAAFAEERRQRAEDAARAAEIAQLEQTIAKEKADYEAAEEARKLRMAQLDIQIREERRAADAAEADAKAKRDAEIRSIEDQIRRAKRADQEAEAARQREIDDLERKVRDERKAEDQRKAREQLALNDLELRALEVRQQIDGLANKPRLAEIADAQAVLNAKKDELGYHKAQEEIQTRLAALPLEQRARALKEEMAAALKPLEDQERALTRQKQALQDQKQDWSNVKQGITDSLSELRAYNKELKDAAKNKPGEDPAKTLTIPIDKAAEAAKAKALALGGELAEKIKDGLSQWFQTNKEGLIAGGIGAALGGMAFGPLGALVGGKLGAAIWEKTKEKLADAGMDMDDVKERLTSMLTGFIERAEAFGRDVWPILQSAFAWLKDEGLPAARDGFMWAAEKVGYLLDKTVELAGYLKENKALDEWTAAAVSFKDQVFEIAGAIKDFGLALLSNGKADYSLKDFAKDIKDFGTVLDYTITFLGSVTTATIKSFEALVKLTQAYSALKNGDLPAANRLFGEAKTAAEGVWSALDKGSEQWARKGAENARKAAEEIKRANENASVEEQERQRKHEEATTAIREHAFTQTLLALGKFHIDGKALHQAYNDVVADLTGQQSDDMQAKNRLLAAHILGMWEKVKDDTTEWLDKTKTDALAKWEALRTGVESTLTTAGDSVLSTVIGAWRDVKQKSDEAFGLNGDTIPGVVSKGWEAVSTAVTTALTGGEGGQGGIVKKVSDGWASVKGAVLEALFGKANEDGNATGGIVGAVKQMGTDILGVFDGWLAAGSELLNRAKSLGGGMLAQIKAGMSGELGNLEDWITENIGKKLPEWMQQLLGIHSPSTVFAEIGSNLMRGLIVGMDGKRGELMGTITDIYENLKGKKLVLQIGQMAMKLFGNQDAANAVMAVAESEGASGDLSKVGTGGARGPFQFDPGGELKNFARQFGMSLDEAGDYIGRNPLKAAKWALSGGDDDAGYWGEGYIGRAVRDGLAKGLRGWQLADYISRKAQRPHEDYAHRAGDIHRDLFGYDKGGDINEPIVGIGAHTGRGYLFGENGPERVSPRTPNGAGQGGLGEGPVTVVVYLDGEQIGGGLARIERRADLRGMAVRLS